MGVLRGHDCFKRNSIPGIFCPKVERRQCACADRQIGIPYDRNWSSKSTGRLAPYVRRCTVEIGAAALTVRNGHDAEGHERLLNCIENLETGLPGSGQWRPTGYAAMRVRHSLRSPTATALL